MQEEFIASVCRQTIDIITWQNRIQSFTHHVIKFRVYDASCAEYIRVYILIDISPPRRTTHCASLIEHITDY